jgi:O-antigen/teichoic acid export membrane protein
MTFNFAKSSFWILIIANSANVAQYLSQLVLGRYLTVTDYGIYNAVNSLGVLVVAFIAAIPFIVSKYMIIYQDNHEFRNYLLNKIINFIYLSSFIILAILFLFVEEIRTFLKIESLTPIYIFSVLIFLNMIYMLYDSILQGLRMYVTHSVQGAILVFVRLLFIMLLIVYLSHSYNAALLTHAFATVIVLVFIFHISSKKIRVVNKNINIPRTIYNDMFRYSIPVMHTWGILILISHMDIPLVKHYFDEYQAGIYSSASIIGKIGYFLPTVLLRAFFPEVINNEKLGKSSIPLLAFMLGITLLICASYVLVVFFFKEALITLLFGEKYLLAEEYLTRITIFMSIVGVITVLFNFFLAKEIYFYLYTSTIVMFIGCLTFVFHEMNSPNDILNKLLYTSTALLVTTILHTFYYYREHLYKWFYKARYS